MEGFLARVEANRTTSLVFLVFLESASTGRWMRDFEFWSVRVRLGLF